MVGKARCVSDLLAVLLAYAVLGYACYLGV
jgi:hypothetical protein